MGQGTWGELGAQEKAAIAKGRHGYLSNAILYPKDVKHPVYISSPPSASPLRAPGHKRGRGNESCRDSC